MEGNGAIGLGPSTTPSTTEDASTGGTGTRSNMRRRGVQRALVVGNVIAVTVGLGGTQSLAFDTRMVGSIVVGAGALQFPTSRIWTVIFSIDLKLRWTASVDGGAFSSAFSPSLFKTDEKRNEIVRT